MDSKRINCMATCKDCKRAVNKRKLLLPGLYFCQFYGKYENLSDVRRCRKFLCKHRGQKNECKICRGGKR